MTQKLSELKALETEGQYAVWALMDNARGLETVYGADTVLASNLRTFLSTLTGKNYPIQNFYWATLPTFTPLLLYQRKPCEEVLISTTQTLKI